MTPLVEFTATIYITVKTIVAQGHPYGLWIRFPLGGINYYLLMFSFLRSELNSANEHAMPLITWAKGVF